MSVLQKMNFVFLPSLAGKQLLCLTCSSVPMRKENQFLYQFLEIVQQAQGDHVYTIRVLPKLFISKSDRQTKQMLRVPGNPGGGVWLGKVWKYYSILTLQMETIVGLRIQMQGNTHLLYYEKIIPNKSKGQCTQSHSPRLPSAPVFWLTGISNRHFNCYVAMRLGHKGGLKEIRRI